MSELQAIPQQVALDATCMVVFKGPANVAVKWEITNGSGTLSQEATSTGDNGLASAKYTPGLEGSATITVSYGA